jgi:hypothetical protein
MVHEQLDNLAERLALALERIASVLEQRPERAVSSIPPEALSK